MREASRVGWRAEGPVERGVLWVLLDVAVAYVSAVIAIGSSDHTASVAEGPVVERACAVVWFLAIAGRRFAPVPALWAGAAATVVAVAAGLPVTNASLASALALPLVLRVRAPRPALELAAAPVAAALGALAFRPESFVPALVVHVVAWLVGRDGRLRREADAVLRERERERVLAGERARLAGELHDAVGHAVTVMVTHAGAARLLLGDRHAEVRQALAQIERTGREAMADLDQVLGLLTGPGGRPPDLAGALTSLAAALPPAVTAELRLPASLDALSPTTAEAVRRLVQESLTNVVRHAGGARVVVELRLDADAVRVAVSDNGRGGAAASGGGRGLAGMRRRVGRLGGTVEAGPREHGGWSVRARIPFVPPKEAA